MMLVVAIHSYDRLNVTSRMSHNRLNRSRCIWIKTTMFIRLVEQEKVEGTSNIGISRTLDIVRTVPGAQCVLYQAPHFVPASLMQSTI